MFRFDALVVSKVRHFVEYGSEDIWLDLIDSMSGSPQPGAAIERARSYAFPESFMYEGS